MGKKQHRKAAIKVLRAHFKKNKRNILKKGYKESCCKSFQKSPGKRCKRCPCYDLLQKVA